MAVLSECCTLHSNIFNKSWGPPSAYETGNFTIPPIGFFFFLCQHKADLRNIPTLSVTLYKRCSLTEEVLQAQCQTLSP